MNAARLLAVARHTLLESLRARLLPAVAVAMAAAMGAIIVLGSISVGAAERVMLDLGASALHLVTVATTLAVAITTVYKEYERRTLFPLLSTPLSRAEYQAGKFLGLLALSAATLLTAFAIYLACVLPFGDFAPRQLLLPLPMLLEQAVLIAAALFFASFATPAMTSVFSILLFILGRTVWGAETLTNYARAGFARAAVAGMEMAVPALQAFNFNERLLHGPPPAPWDWGFALGYAAVWCTALLAAAAAIFERREIT